MATIGTLFRLLLPLFLFKLLNQLSQFLPKRLRWLQEEELEEEEDLPLILMEDAALDILELPHKEEEVVVIPQEDLVDLEVQEEAAQEVLVVLMALEEMVLVDSVLEDLEDLEDLEGLVEMHLEEEPLAEVDPLEVQDLLI